MNQLIPRPPTPLPAAPLLESILFERPLPLVVLLVLAGLVAFVLLNRRGRAGAGIFALALGVALACGLWILATVVRTDREVVSEQTRELVDAAARTDRAGLSRLLHETAKLSIGGGGWLERDEILDAVDRRLGATYKLHEWAVVKVEASVDSAEVARTQVNVRAETEAARVPNLSWWKIGWRKAADGRWVVTSIEPLSVGGFASPGDVIR
jgi:hypothetical protein